MSLFSGLCRWSAATALLVTGCSTAPEPQAEPAKTTSGPSATPAPDAPELSNEPTDTSGWKTYTSARYRLRVGHPPDWTVTPATRGWRPTDAGNRQSAAHEVFESPSTGIRVSVWKAKLDSRTQETAADIETWVEGYCEKSRNTPCTGIPDRAVDLCLEKWDCHPGLLVPFHDDVQAFVTGGISGQWITIAAVWQAESAPAVEEYGGSRRLLEAFLSTMHVWPASTPREARECYGRPPAGFTCKAPRTPGDSAASPLGSR